MTRHMTSRMIRAILPPLALLALLTPGLAQANLPSTFWDSPEPGERDLGGGLVAELDGRDLPEGRVDYKVIVQCSSGLRIETRLDPALPDLDRRSRAWDAEDIVRAAVASPEAIPFDRLVPLLAGLGETRLLQSREESRGCAEFYPDLRGDKAPWTE